MLSQNVLLESSSARSSLLSTRSNSQSLECLNKAKAVIMATWQGTGHATTEQVADFYNSPVSTVYEHLQNHKEEFANEVKKVVGDELRELKRDSRFCSLIGSTAHHFTLWTPRGMHRLGFMLRDSEVAKHVRDVTLDVVEVVPNIVNEIECEFIKACKKLATMRDVFGMSEDHPDYRKIFESLVSKEFGIEALATNPEIVIESEPNQPIVSLKRRKTKRIPKQIVFSEPILSLNGGESAKQACFIVLVDTLVRKQHMTDVITVGFLTRYSTKLKNLYKMYKREVHDAMVILDDAGYLEKIEINCRGAINYRLLKLPSREQLIALIPTS